MTSEIAEKKAEIRALAERLEHFIAESQEQGHGQPQISRHDQHPPTYNIQREFQDYMKAKFEHESLKAMAEQGLKVKGMPPEESCRPGTSKSSKKSKRPPRESTNSREDGRNNRKNIFEMEKQYLKERIAELDDHLAQRKCLQNDSEKALSDLKENRRRFEEVMKSMDAERECLLQEIEKLRQRSQGFQANQDLNGRQHEEDLKDNSLEEYMRDNEELTYQIEQLQSEYGEKCGDLVDYFIGSIER